MAVTTSKPSKVGNNYYKTSVTTNADGSLSSTTFRTDAKGNNPVAVQTTSVDSNGGNRTVSFGTGATAAEQTAFNNPKSPESIARTQQVQSQNPYGPNPTPEQKKQANLVGGGSGNTATGNGSGGDATSADKKNENASQPQASDVLAASGAATGRKNFPNLRYPLTLEDSKQDKIKFEMLEYKPTTFSQQNLGFQRPGVNRTPIGRVYLPIPAGINDTNNCNWGSDEMNPAQIAASNIALGGITAGGEGLSKAIDGIVSSALKDKGADVKTAVSTLIAGEASGAGSGLLKRVTGGVLNPNLELLFGGPGLRQFGFTFKMSARSEEEAKQIIGILRFFKQGMAPQKSTTNLFVKAPHTFRLTYLHKNKSHKFLNEFKECALTSFTTNYTPEGQYATFYDGPMVSYEIQMQFQELDPVFNEDYTNEKGSFLGTGDSGPDTEIGF